MNNKTLLGSMLMCLQTLANAGESAHHEVCESPPFAITSARVFDGLMVIPSATVVIECTTIARIIDGGTSPDLTPDTITVDGRGKTLLPRLIDSHVHTFSRGMLERSLDFVVTTVFDMGSVSSANRRHSQ